MGARAFRNAASLLRAIVRFTRALRADVLPDGLGTALVPSATL